MSNMVVQVLDKKHLIRPELRSMEKWYELTHDRLIKSIKSSNQKWKQERNRKRKSRNLKMVIPSIIVGIIVVGAPYLFMDTYRASSN